MKRKLIAFLAVIGVAVFMVACSDTDESNRQVVVVSTMNDGFPFFSDVLDQGDTLFVGGAPFTQDDYLQEDWIPITFHNRRYNSLNITAEGLPFSDFLITNYRVDWARADGGPAADVPPTFFGATSLRCEIDEFTTGYFVLVPFDVKLLGWAQNINYLNPQPAGGFPDEYQMIATYTFTGHEIGSDREETFQASVTVNFADPVVRSEEN